MIKKIFFLVLFLILLVSPIEASWFNQSWEYREEINISNTAGVLTDYQVKITLNTTNFNYSHANTTGKDIRFTNSSDNSLDHWIESWNATGESNIWVEVNSLASATNTSIYMYYGNNEATYNNTQGGNNTFYFFDDFEGTLDTTNKWDYEDNYPNLSGGIANFSRPSGVNADHCGIIAKTALSSGTNYTVRTRIKWNQVHVFDDRYSVFGWGGSWQFKAGIVGAILRDGTGSTTNLQLQEFFNSGTYSVGDTINAINADYKTYEVSIITNGTIIAKNIDDSNTVSKAQAYTTILKPSMAIEDHPTASASTEIWILSKYIFVRQYASTEPTYTIGAEETSGDTTAPTSNSPSDASYVQSSSQTIGWILQDETGAGNYTILRNSSTQNASTSWTNNTNLGVWVNTSTVGNNWNYTIRFNDSSGNEGIQDSVFINITSAGEPDTNFEIYNGSSWIEFNDTNDIEFRGTPTQTNCEPTNQNAGSSQSIFKITNNGTASGNVNMKINQTFTGIDLKCDDDYTSDGATILTTSYQQIHGTLTNGNSIYVSCWTDYNNPTSGGYFRISTNITS